MMLLIGMESNRDHPQFLIFALHDIEHIIEQVDVLHQPLDGGRQVDTGSFGGDDEILVLNEEADRIMLLCIGLLHRLEDL